MNTLEKINIAILLATVSYIVAIDDLLSRVDDIEPATRWIITILTSVGLFRLLFVFVFWGLKRSDTLLALYHRERFLKGLWTYRYEVDGQEHLGIWRVAQDLTSISVTGYGIDSAGRIDSHFRSISQMFEHQGVEEIMFSRTDSKSGDDHFAKSTLYIDGKSRPNWFSGPTFMRVQSVLYGFEESGLRHADLVLRRVADERSEAQIVEELCGSTRMKEASMDLQDQLLSQKSYQPRKNRTQFARGETPKTQSLPADRNACDAVRNNAIET